MLLTVEINGEIEKHGLSGKWELEKTTGFISIWKLDTQPGELSEQAYQ
jgi:hypothetical protein